MSQHLTHSAVGVLDTNTELFAFYKGQMACCYGQWLSWEVFRKLLLLHEKKKKSWWILCTCNENPNLNLEDDYLMVWHLSWPKHSSSNLGISILQPYTLYWTSLTICWAHECNCWQLPHLDWVPDGIWLVCRSLFWPFGLYWMVHLGRLNGSC